MTARLNAKKAAILDLADATARLNALKAAKSKALDEMRATLQRAQEAFGASDHPLVRTRLDLELAHAMQCCTDTVDDLLFSEVEEARQEVEAAENELNRMEVA